MGLNLSAIFFHCCVRWPRPLISVQNFAEIVDVDVDVEELRAQANASMPASYIAKLINLLILILISNF